MIKSQQGEVIYVDGYYIPEGKAEGSFTGYQCIIGEWNGDEDDHDIFYYFADEAELKLFMETEGRTDTEFVITRVVCACGLNPNDQQAEDQQKYENERG